MKEKGSHVALTKCFFCMGDHQIILHKRLGDVSEFHGKVVDLSPCNKCQEYMEQGIILLTIDESKSPDGWEKDKVPNPFRTGGFFVITEEGFKGIFNTEDHPALTFGLKHRWMFIEHQAAVEMGLIEE